MTLYCTVGLSPALGLSSARADLALEQAQLVFSKLDYPIAVVGLQRVPRVLSSALVDHFGKAVFVRSVFDDLHARVHPNFRSTWSWRLRRSDG